LFIIYRERLLGSARPERCRDATGIGERTDRTAIGFRVCGVVQYRFAKEKRGGGTIGPSR